MFNMISTTKLKVETLKKSFIVKNLYDKTVNDFNFGRHEDLPTLKK